MAGINLTDSQRSKILEQLLAKQANPLQGRRVSSIPQVFAELGAQYLRQQKLNELQEQDKKSEQNLADALAGRASFDQRSTTLESVDGSDPMTIDTSRRYDPKTRLSPEQMFAVQQYKANEQKMNAKPEPKRGIQQIREGQDYVTYETINGELGREISRSPIKESVSDTVVNANPQISLPGEENAKPTINNLEDVIVKSNDQIAILDPLIEDFDESFFTLAGRLKGKVLEAQDLAGMDLTDSQKQFLVDRSTYMANAAEGLNTYINQLSGAAVSPEEAERLLKGFPDAEGDSPTVFFAKLQAKYKQAKIAVARAKLGKMLGVTNIDQIQGLSTLNPESFKRSVQRAGDQWYKKAIDSGMSPEDASKLVAGRVVEITNIGGSVLDL